jgi:hypothetical protein
VFEKNIQKRRPLQGISTTGILTSLSRLAEVRTGLDSFSDEKAYALMLGGYRMTQHYFASAVPEILASAEPVSAEPSHPWRCLEIESAALWVIDRETA